MFGKPARKHYGKRDKNKEVKNMFEECSTEIQLVENDFFYVEEDEVEELNEAEGGRSRGEVMEIGIVDAWNNKGKVTPKVAKLLENQNPPIPSSAPEKIVKAIQKQLKGGDAVVLGADQVDVSDEWKKFWPGGVVPRGTKTPKTDIKLGPARVSLKSGKAAQLMSGGKNESKATFYTAAEKADVLKKNVFKEAQQALDNLSTSNVAKSTLGKAIKEGQDEVINAVDKAHKSLMKQMQFLFDKSPEFKREFAYEAMTGLVKFDNNEGTCDYFLCVDWEGSKVKLKICTDREYVEHIADQMKISVRFKSTSVKKMIQGKKTKTGEYRYWSVIGLIIDKLTEEVTNAGDDISSLMNEEVESLNEAEFGRVKTFLKDLWDKIRKTVSDYLDKAWGWIVENVRRLFVFLGIIPEVEGWSDEDEAEEMNQNIDYLGENGGTVAELNL